MYRICSTKILSNKKICALKKKSKTKKDMAKMPLQGVVTDNKHGRLLLNRHISGVSTALYYLETWENKWAILMAIKLF